MHHTIHTPCLPSMEQQQAPCFPPPPPAAAGEYSAADQKQQLPEIVRRRSPQPKPWEIPKANVVAALVPDDGSEVSAVSIPINPNTQMLEIRKLVNGKTETIFLRTKGRRPRTLLAIAIVKQEDSYSDTVLPNPKVEGLFGNVIVFERAQKYEEYKNMSIHNMVELNRFGAAPFKVLEDAGLRDDRLPDARLFDRMSVVRPPNGLPPPNEGHHRLAALAQ